MTKKNLIIVIVLLALIDLVAAGWYTSRLIESSGKSQNFFGQRDSTEVIAMADTVTSASQADVFDELQHNTYYFIANTPAVAGNNNSCYTSIKHVKVRWPKKVNGDEELTELNKELIKKAFDNNQSQLKDARYTYLNTPEFNKPIGDDYRTLVKAPTIYPTYGNVSQVLVYPQMTSQRLLVMEIDKVVYDGSSTDKSSTYVHYDRQKGRVLSRMDILQADAGLENKLLKVINKKIDDLNRGRGDDRKLQHAMNVPADICCGKKGITFLFKPGSIYDGNIEIQVDYDKLEPFFTPEFKQMQANNEGFKIFDDDIKPEPINSRSQEVKKPAPAVAKQAPVVKKHKKKSYYNNGYKQGYKQGYRNYRKQGYKKKGYNNQNQQGSDQQGDNSVTPAQTKKKRYSGAKRKSGRYGYAGQRRSKHRRQ